MTQRGPSPLARTTFATLWFASFLVCLVVLVELWLRDYLHTEKFLEGARAVSGVYAPYLVAVGFFQWRRRSASPRKPDMRFILALLSSVVWNGLILAVIVPLAFYRGDIETATSTLTSIGGTFSWLVAGAIGFYFVTPEQSPKS
jgi:hypothetical protein